MLASMGVLGEYKGSQAREVMMTLEQYEQLRESMEAEQGEYVDEGEAGEGEAGTAQTHSGSPEGEYHYAAVEEHD